MTSINTAQLATEVVRTNLQPSINTTQIAVEVIRGNNDPVIELGQVFVEVLCASEPMVKGQQGQFFVCT